MARNREMMEAGVGGHWIVDSVLKHHHGYLTDPILLAAKAVWGGGGEEEWVEYEEIQHVSRGLCSYNDPLQKCRNMGCALFSPSMKGAHLYLSTQK